MKAGDPLSAAKTKLAWCAVACATACRLAQNSRTHLAATSNVLRNSVTSSAAADIPDFVAVDLCARTALDKAQCPSAAGRYSN